MKVLHVIPTLSPEHGGPSESVWRLVVGLHEQRLADVSLWATDVDTSVKFIDSCLKRFDKVVFFKGYRRPIKEFSPQLARDLFAKVGQFELVHIHSVFNCTSLLAAWACARSGIPHVVSPRGMLQSWSLKQKAVPKEIYRKLVLDRQMRRARGIHVTSDLEQDAILALYPDARTVCIPNPLPGIGTVPGKSFLAQFPEFQKKRILLYLSRIHRKKGVAELLEAWRTVTDEFPEWHLVLVGPGERRSVREMQTAIRRLGLDRRVSWVGPLFGADRDEAYKAAELFVQPSYQENFGNSIAEAIASGCPVVTTQETPWKILQDRKWGWWVPMSVESLTAALRDALRCNRTQLHRMGEQGKHWIETECSVESVARRMADWYRQLLGKG